MSPIGRFGCVIGKIVHPLEAPVAASIGRMDKVDPLYRLVTAKQQ